MHLLNTTKKLKVRFKYFEKQVAKVVYFGNTAFLSNNKKKCVTPNLMNLFFS